MGPRDKADAIAARIADGSTVDWAEAGSTSSGNAGDSLVDALHAIEEVATLHRAPLEDDVSEAPTTWGPLTIQSPIGAGRFGQVYLAWDARLQRRVALKLLNTTPASAVESPSNPIHEARLLARVRHPNVLTVHGADVFDGRAGIWTEFIEGQTLEAIIHEKGALPADEVIAIGRDLASALAAVHEAGTLHRDIKAQNVMREVGGRIVLMDFGTGLDQSAMSLRSGDLSGTPLYLAPELFKGASPSVVSDTYSLAVLLFRLLTGQFPITGRTLDEVRAGHSVGGPTRVRDVQPAAARSLAQVIDRGLAADPAGRYASAAGFEHALRALARPVSSSRYKKLVWAGVAIAAAATLAIALWSRPTRFSFQAGDSILVTEFVNHTGDPSLDRRITIDVERELASSQFVNLVERARIIDALALMRRPPTTVIDDQTGLEICRRDGEIRAFVTGAVNKVGTGYLVTATLVDPRNAPVASVVENVASVDALDGGARRLAAKLKLQLGESLQAVEKSTQESFKVTTPRVDAYELYTQAHSQEQVMGLFAGVAKPEDLLQEAIDLDPDFGSAYTLRALKLVQRGAPANEYREMARLGVVHSAGLTVREQEWNKAIDRLLTGELPEAIALLQAYLDKYPADLDGASVLSRLYEARGESDKAAKLLLHLAELKPKNLYANALAAYLSMDVQAAPNLAARFLQRAKESPMIEASTSSSDAAVWIEFLPVRASWLSDDMPAAEAALDRLEAISPLRSSSMFASQMALMRMTMGEFGRAETYLNNGPTRKEWQTVFLAQLAFIRDDRAGVLRALDGMPSGHPSPFFAALLARMQRLEPAQQAVAVLKGESNQYADLISGEVALARGETTRAIDVILRELRVPRLRRHPVDVMAADSLATALESNGDFSRAIDVLEAVSADRAKLWAPAGSQGAFWLVAQAKLAKVYREANRISEAITVETRLARLLSYADRDHPILKQLARTSAQAR